MWQWFVGLDRILRGEATQLADLRTGRIEVPLFGLTVVSVILAVVYGACMGAFALLRPSGPELQQLMASAVKTPLLFFVTLAITFPSLYVFNALVGSRLNVENLLRLLIAAIGVNVAVLASLGPIVAFFAVSSTSYAFMVLLNVVVFAVAGLLGLTFLLQTLHRINRAAMANGAPPPVTSAPAEAAPAKTAAAKGALSRLDGHVLGRHVTTVFICWMVVFGLVGAQTGWLLRPFIGDPEMPFEWFRARESNFFEAIILTVRSLLGGG